MISVEQLETRNAPGGVAGAITQPDNDLLVMAEMAPRQWYPVDLPRNVDVVMIGTQRSAYLDAAHDAIPRRIPERDVGSVNSLNDTVDEFFFRKGTPLSIVIVATSTPSGRGFVLGQNYFLPQAEGSDSGASEIFWNRSRGKVAEILFLVTADGKDQLFQQTCDGLTAGGVVTITAYSGMLRVAGQPPEFVTTGDIQQWHSQ